MPHKSRSCNVWEVRPRAACTLAFVLLSALSAQAQLIGYVATRDADVTGAADTIDGRAVLSGSASLTAKDHTAPVTLARGGKLQVCQTSILHLTESKAATLNAPLLLSLDRGALEIQMASTAADALMTPDLHFAVRTGGPLDLRLRVARNGDTCVENRGTQAPTLAVTDPFGEALYEILPNQHVLFEHGSLREVVDHESTPCGCPDTGASLAEALLKPGATAKADQHPFPAAVSEGLAPAPEVPQAPPGQVHAQVTDTFTRNADPELPRAPAPVAVAATPPPAPAPPPSHNPFRAVGHFFRKLFGGSS